jgi:hypothetical protein
MYKVTICTCLAYRLHYANSQMGYYICAEYIKCHVNCDMYLSIYRLHHAESQMGPICRIYAMSSNSVICTCFLYRLHHTKQPDGLFICAKYTKLLKNWICTCSYTDYIMRNSQKGYICVPSI